jgi:hypothetical protein
VGQIRCAKWAKSDYRNHEIPPQISAIAGDVIHNLRSVLDHMVWQLVLANNGTPTPGVTGFPVSNSPQEHTSRKFRGKIEGVGPDVIDAIDTLKPYYGGDEAVWRLHGLNNRDKHRLLLSAVSALTHHHLLPSQRERLIEGYFGSYPDATEPPDLKGVFIKPTTARFPLEVGKVFLSIPESEMENNFTFGFGVVFNEPGIIEGDPVLDTIKLFYGRVGQIVTKLAPFL